MIAHLVLIKLGRDLDGNERRELERAIARLGSVPGVQEPTWGRDFSGRGKGYEYGAVMHFETRETLAAYAGDATHRQIIAIFDRLGVERLVVDYEIGTSGSST